MNSKLREALDEGPPLHLLKAHARTLFSKPRQSPPEFWADVARTCGKAYGVEQLQKWAKAGDHDAILEYARAWDNWGKRPPGGLNRARIQFLVTYWGIINAPGMTSKKAWLLAKEKLKKDEVGTFDTFRHFLIDNDIHLTRKGHPKANQGPK